MPHDQVRGRRRSSSGHQCGRALMLTVTQLGLDWTQLIGTNGDDVRLPTN
jgi:hypothetical protein